MLGECVGYLGSPLTSHSAGFMVRSLGGVQELVSRICHYLLRTTPPIRCTPSPFLCSYLSPDDPHCQSPQGSGRVTQKWSPRQHLTMLGKLTLAPLSLSPMETGLRGLSWQGAMLPWGRGDAGKVKLFLPSSMYLLSDCLLH